MRCFYLKLGQGNEEAALRLGQQMPTAAVFFDDCSEADYQKGLGKSQAHLFWERGKQANRDETVMVVINGGQIWLLRPIGDVTFSAPYVKNGSRLTTKEMPVQILHKKSCKDVPPILAGIGCSQYHGRRTFTEIGHWGNLKAIDYVLGRLNDARLFEEEHWNLQYQTPAQLVECLGSIELETLVGKLLEAHGCHVPAYLGGTLRDIDILAYNDGRKVIDVNGIRIQPGMGISLQVKTWSNEPRSDAVDYLVSLSPPPDPASYGSDWLLKTVRQTPSVLQWMERSLNWLPPTFLQKFGL